MKQGSVYSSHPAFKMVETSKRNIVERTGKTYREWVDILRRDGPAGEREQREWLKSVHGFAMNYARWIVDEAAGRGPDTYDPDAEVEAQYAGKKSSLRPIYDELLRLASSLGPDVRACPCSTMVPFYRKNVFAQVKPATQSRIDLGLCLRGVPAGGRLIDTGGGAKGDRITHRIPVSSLDEVDEEARSWLRRAYDAAA
ncbi:MAG TPA: DUF5655 domain-containing protein [Fimbriimonadaceae bacterium]|nr:DUF5655 domain-containing protein [Fimbriimonadaceae bacterium]